VALQGEYLFRKLSGANCHRIFSSEFPSPCYDLSTLPLAPIVADVHASCEGHPNLSSPVKPHNQKPAVV
jgi:hypothetical protein